MEFYNENCTYCVHNKGRNYLTLELSFPDVEKSKVTASTTPLLMPLEFSLINDTSSRANLKIEIVHPFAKNFKFHYKFLLKYLLHILYNKPALLKITCFDDELAFDDLFDTFCELVNKTEVSKQMERKRETGINRQMVFNNNNGHMQILIGKSVVYETKDFF